MKRSRKDVQGKASKTLNVQFDEQPLTLFSGLIVFQRLFIHLALKEKLRHCFRHRQEIPPTNIISSSSCSSFTDFSAFVICEMSNITTSMIWSNEHWA